MSLDDSLLASPSRSDRSGLGSDLADSQLESRPRRAQLRTLGGRLSDHGSLDSVAKTISRERGRQRQIPDSLKYLNVQSAEQTRKARLKRELDALQ